MNELVVVGVLEGLGDLLDILHDGGHRHTATFGMPGAQGAAGGVGHDEVGSGVLDPEVKYTHNVGML